MPVAVEVQRLEQQAGRRIARDLINCLIRLEENQLNVSVNRDSSQSDEELSDLVESFNRELLVLQSTLDSIPGALLDPIHTALLEDYCSRYSRIEAGLAGSGVHKLTSGVLGNLIFSELYAGSSDYVPDNWVDVPLPKLRSLLSLFFLRKVLTLNLRPLLHLSTVGETVFQEFKEVLTTNLPKVVNLISLNLSSPNSKTSLPQIENKHLQLLGQHCPNLQELDISFHRLITGEGIRNLAPGKDRSVHPGCTKLVRLLIFDTGIFEKEVAKLVVHLPDLEFLGYKETGKVIRTLHRNQEIQPLKLTHVDNRGSKTRRLVVTSLRCKKPMIVAISELCPAVRNLKLRVSDDDVMALAALNCVESVELLYHVGNIQTPGVGTQVFLEARGAQLTSLTLICQNMTVLMLSTIAETCSNLGQLWFRSNHFLAGSLTESLPQSHSYLTKLQTLYLRIGEGELYIVHNLPDTVLPFLLRNAPLKELILAIRSNLITDRYIIDLIQNCKLQDLEKILIVVPGVNSLSSILNLTELLVDFIINHCKNIRKIGNLLSWRINRLFVTELMQSIKENCWDLSVINKKMTMR